MNRLYQNASIFLGDSREVFEAPQNSEKLLIRSILNSTSIFFLRDSWEIRLDSLRLSKTMGRTTDPSNFPLDIP